MTDISPLSPSVLLADDEPLLLEALEDELKSLWPEVDVVSRSQSGTQAIREIQTRKIDIAFLDIQMPGANGLEVVQTIIEDWPEVSDPEYYPLPLFVFVTAFTEHAIEAFELAAVDYVVKPVTAKRMIDTVERLKLQMGSRVLAQAPEAINDKIVKLLTTTSEEPGEKIQTIRATVGDQVYLIPVEDVILFEASDKYIEVHTANRSVVIRESLRALLPQLDDATFTQIHRKSIVNLKWVEAATKDPDGKVRLELNNSERRPVVSRLYRHLFQGR